MIGGEAGSVDRGVIGGRLFRLQGHGWIVLGIWVKTSETGEKKKRGKCHEMIDLRGKFGV